jgi:putative toxin-antitoxin system antitoxin component (TIGR02293 family)
MVANVSIETYIGLSGDKEFPMSASNLPMIEPEAPEAVQIAEFIGLPHAKTFSPMKLADTIKLGMPVTAVKNVVKRVDPLGTIVNVYDFVPKATLSRRAKDRKRLSRDVSEKLWQVARVYVEAQRQYGDDGEARAFLSRPHPLLENRTPLEIAMETVAGTDLVLKLLSQAEAGVAV